MTPKNRAAALLAAAIAAQAAPAAADATADLTTYLQQFIGEWAGTGQSRTGVEAPYVDAACNISIWWARGALRTDGNCSGARQTFSAGGALAVANGTLSGTFLQPYFAEPASSSVSIENGALVVRSTYQPPEPEPPIDFRVTIQPPTAGAFEMRTEARAAGGAFVDVATIRLLAQ